MKKLSVIMAVLFCLYGCEPVDGFSQVDSTQLIVTVLLCVASISFIYVFFSASAIVPLSLHVLAILAVYSIYFFSGTLTFLAVIIGLVGFVCIALEIVVPGGVLGIIGFAALLSSLLMVAPSLTGMLYSILIALGVAIIGMVIMLKFFSKKLNVFNKMVLSDATDTESGYVSNVNRTELLGKVAITATALRPSGTAMYEGERLDVVSEGAFIPNNTEVEIIEVEGVRIVVRPKSV